MLGVVQSLVTLIVLVLLFQGKGSHSVFVAIFVAVPVLRFILQRSYREECRKLVLADWTHLVNFTQENRPKIPWKSALRFVGLPMVILSLANGVNISSMDNFPTSLVASSLVLEGNTEISEFPPSKDQTAERMCRSEVPMPYYYRCTKTGIHSAYPPGMLAVAVPFTFISHWVGGNVSNGYNQWRLAKWASSCIAGISLSFFLLLSLRLVAAKAALVMAISLGVGSTFLSIVGQGLWTQSGVMLGALIVLFYEVVEEDENSFKRILTQSLAIALMLYCRLTACAIIAPVGLWIFFRNWKRGLILTGVSLILVLPLLIYFGNVYGNILGPQAQMAAGNPTATHPHLSTVYGILLSPVCGLMVYQPWLWAFLFLLVPAVRYRFFELRSKRLPRGMSWVLWSSIVLHIFILSWWHEWWSGVYGTRHLTEIIPLMALLLLGVAQAMLEIPLAKKGLVGLIVLSALMQAMGVFAYGGKWYYDPKIHKDGITQENKLFDWTDPPFLYPILHR